MSVEFLIKHKSSGKFIHPYGGHNMPLAAFRDTPLVVHPDIHGNMHWRFIRKDGIYGYIQHVASGKIVHPYGGDLTPDRDTPLVLHSDQHSACLFALDDVRHWIIHKAGLKAHPRGGRPDPNNDTLVVLHPDVHDAMTWLFVDPHNPTKEISIYGKPTVAAEWKIVNEVRNPIATHEVTFIVRKGKSKTKSTSHSFQFKWEIGAKAEALFLSYNTSASFQYDVRHSSSETWSEETTVTRKIHGLFSFFSFVEMTHVNFIEKGIYFIL